MFYNVYSVQVCMMIMKSFLLYRCSSQNLILQIFSSQRGTDSQWCLKQVRRISSILFITNFHCITCKMNCSDSFIQSVKKSPLYAQIWKYILFCDHIFDYEYTGQWVRLQARHSQWTKMGTMLSKLAIDKVFEIQSIVKVGEVINN